MKLEASFAALNKGSIVRQKKVKASNTKLDTAVNGHQMAWIDAA